MEHRKDIYRGRYDLQPLSEEGGFFVETHRSSEEVEVGEDYEGNTRSKSTSIYYMLVADSESGGRNYLHRNKSGIIHTFCDGWHIAEYLST